MVSLSNKDKQSLLDLIHGSVECNSREEFQGLIYQLRDITPFEHATCLLRQFSPIANKVMDEVVNVNYSQEWLGLYIEKDFQYIDPILVQHFKNMKLQFWEDTYKTFSPPNKFLRLANSFGLTKGYTHGARDTKGRETSLLSFAGPSIERYGRTEAIINYTVPHFHQALSRLSKMIPYKDKVFLTPREKEVLRWVAQGKNSWDISMILCISERTINFHVSSLMQKLDAVTRAHAVAIAFDLGLICID